MSYEKQIKEIASSLNEKINTLDFNAVKQDLAGFIPIDRKSFLDSFNKTLFHSAVKTMSEYCGKNKEKHRDDDYNRGR